MSNLATCIGCGCDDFNACDEGCHWLRVDYSDGLGVCSACPEFVEQWDGGDHTAHARPLREIEAELAGELRIARPELPKPRLKKGEACRHDWPFEDVRDDDQCRWCGMGFLRHVFTECP